MTGIKKMLTSELAIAVILGICAATNITRPATQATPVQIVVVGKAQVPAVQATVYGASYCTPCKAMARDIKAEMTADSGWTWSDDTDKASATSMIVLTKDTTHFAKLGIESIPCTIIRRNGKEAKRIQGRITPDDLAKAYNEVAKQKD